MTGSPHGCREVLDALAAWLEGALAADAADALEEHLVLCADCAAYLESYASTLALARDAWARDGTVVAALPEAVVDELCALRFPT